MPEICEVALTAQYLLTKLKGRYITGMTVVAGKYTHLALPGGYLIEERAPLKVMDIDSKGKMMWFVLKDKNGGDVFIINKFGLTGEWSFYDDKNDRIVFDVEGGGKKYKLHYSDQRNFGLLYITDKRSVLDEKVEKLAPDLLKNDFSDEDFVRWVGEYLKVSARRKDVPIVSVLMKQDKKDGVGSGIGNYLSSEILYRAKISPLRKIGDLSRKELKRLAGVIRHVTKLCYMSNVTGYMKKLRRFMKTHAEKVKKGVYPNYHPEINVDNEEFTFLTYGRDEDDLGNPVVSENIDGTRNTYWVPDVQE
ncbi:MAG: formamidopyrimidine-DNA glycosylase [Hyperionvirus sp.]|uniref:Formamidopyrimidine-DNA glycosylase n=1 Tax=Hyperionvirus sp. TaxID=2487770 RepID=A0A3G5ADU1_9VIRU|nr:MAG: formamidopyrimidine-DNA glycosylase [Hyperionvirus sp.]